MINAPQKAPILYVLCCIPFKTRNVRSFCLIWALISISLFRNNKRLWRLSESSAMPINGTTKPLSHGQKMRASKSVTSRRSSAIQQHVLMTMLSSITRICVILAFVLSSLNALKNLLKMPELKSLLQS